MKTRKLFYPIALATLAIFSVASCSEECEGENPRARIVNNGTTTVDVQIKTSDGNTVNINGVDQNSISEYKSYVAGDITFNVSIDKVSKEIKTTVANCYEYDFIIDENDSLSTVATDRNE